MATERSVWRRLKFLQWEAPLVYWFLVLWLSMELIVAVVCPLLIPKPQYLRLYLGANARQNTHDFYSGKSDALVFDIHCGWRNTPGFSRDNWQIDEHGSRSTQPLSLERGSKHRVLFLGSSLINGGMGVDVDETISAAIEDSSIEALNVATMLYSPDQSLLSYLNHYQRYMPDVVVVGLSGHPTEGLSNGYIPLRMRSEVNMPYFKPRLGLQDGALAVTLPPQPTQALAALSSSDALDRILENDAYSSNFEGYVRYAHTPILSQLWHFDRKVRNFTNLLRSDYPDMHLLNSILNALATKVRSAGGDLVLVLVPPRSIVDPGWRRHLPDQYGAMVDQLHGAGFAILDGRDVLRNSGEQLATLYDEDQQHLTSNGNRVMGAALKPLIVQAMDGH